MHNFVLFTFLTLFMLLIQLSSEIFDPRKMDANILEANFEYSRLSTAKDDRNSKDCPSYFLGLGIKIC